VTHEPRSPDDYKHRLAKFEELVHLTVEVNRCPVRKASGEGELEL